MFITCGGLKMARFKIELKYLINFCCINMNTNDYQFHPQYHRPMASIIYLANWWIFLGMMIDAKLSFISQLPYNNSIKNILEINAIFKLLVK